MILSTVLSPSVETVADSATVPPGPALPLRRCWRCVLECTDLLLRQPDRAVVQPDPDPGIAGVGLKKDHFSAGGVTLNHELCPSARQCPAAGTFSHSRTHPVHQRATPDWLIPFIWPLPAQHDGVAVGGGDRQQKRGVIGDVELRHVDGGDRDGPRPARPQATRAALVVTGSAGGRNT